MPKGLSAIKIARQGSFKRLQITHGSRFSAVQVFSRAMAQFGENNRVALDKEPVENNNNTKQQVLEVLQLTGEIIVFILKFWWTVAVSIYKLFAPVPLKPVRGEIVLVTGAGHGIGKELALQYASEGATVVCWDISGKNNQGTVEEISKLGYPKAHAYECNVANREEVMATAKRVLEEVGDVSVLINNAGVMPCHSFDEHTVDEIERIMNINVMAHFWTLQAFLPTMKKNNHGHVVAISSMAGLMGFRNLMPYCTSKFAVRGMMEGLFQDLHTDPKCQIKLTLVYPYGVDTGLCKNPKLRFPTLLKLLKPRSVARYIMRAQRRDVFETSVPRFWLSVIYYLRLFPVKCLVQVDDFMDSYLDTDL